MDKSVKMDKLTLGICYYPEHWDRSLWRDDLSRMKEFGVSFIRIAEFAWNKFEPAEDTYTFDLFDDFMVYAQEADMKVIFCTPTATPPAWLSEKYPEILNADQTGNLYRHGLRRHYNYNSSVFRRFASVITQKLAEHYAGHPQIIGWQIDNEMNCEKDLFYSESDHAAFRAYMKEKYQTLDKLNECMGTVFWNQTYTSWDELYLPRLNYHDTPNPHIALEERRFISKSVIDFCAMQADILKKYLKKGQFLTATGLFGHLDYNEMTERALDFISYDCYPNFAFDFDADPREPDALNDRKWSFNLSYARSVSPCFGVMEQQSGAGGWTTRMLAPMPKPGQMRLWALQSVAQGADFVSFFRWRTAPMGTEIYWHGINDHSNKPNRRLKELTRVASDFKALSFISGARYRANVAMLADYPNLWDADNDKVSSRVSDASYKGLCQALQYTHTPADFIYLHESTTVEQLRPYGLLFYAHAPILDEKTAGLLREYVQGGGVLVMGCATGYKDEYGRCPMTDRPGPAAQLCGIRVSDYTFIGPYDEEQSADWGGDTIETPVWNDILEPVGQNAAVEAVYRGNYYSGLPALIKNTCGSGAAYYFGSVFTYRTAAAFLCKLGFAGPYADMLELPRECEIAVREKDGTPYFFVLNYKEYPVSVGVKRPMTDLLTGKRMYGAGMLEPYGVMVLKKE